MSRIGPLSHFDPFGRHKEWTRVPGSPPPNASGGWHGACILGKQESPATAAVGPQSE